MFLQKNLFTIVKYIFIKEIIEYGSGKRNKINYAQILNKSENNKSENVPYFTIKNHFLLQELLIRINK